MASESLVDAHMIVNKYWFLALLVGMGPTQSISTWLNGSLTAGIGFKGVTGVLWFGLPMSNWQVWQDLQNDSLN